jgi:hypothetical protein
VSERSRNRIVYSINNSAFDEAAAEIMVFFAGDGRGSEGTLSQTMEVGDE